MPAPGNATLTNPVKERMQAGEVALGLNVRIARSGDIARIARTTGHDFIFIDVQHSLFSLETIGHIAQAALGCGVAPLARVRSCADPDTSLLLDNGVTGIVFPDVNNAADARRGVDAAKFAPIGKRSVSGGYPVFDYRAVPVGDSMRLLNQATLVVCMIETREGLGQYRGDRRGRRGRCDPYRQQRSFDRARQTGPVRRPGNFLGDRPGDRGGHGARQVRRARRHAQCRASGRADPQGCALRHDPDRYRLSAGRGLALDRRSAQCTGPAGTR